MKCRQNMQNSNTDIVEQLRSVCLEMDKATKLDFLAGRWIYYNGVVNQMARPIQMRGTQMIDGE